MLKTVFNPFNRCPKDLGDKRNEEILGVKLTPSTEAATHVIFNQLHMVFVQTHHLRQSRTVPKGHLSSAKDIHLLRVDLPLSQHATGFHRHGRNSLDDEFFFSGISCVVKDELSISLFGAVGQGGIAFGVIEQSHRIGFGRFNIVGNVQILNVELNKAHGIFCDGGRLGHHQGNGFTNKTNFVAGNDRLLVGVK